MALFLDDAVPQLLGANLLRFAPAYNAQMAIQPAVKHDFMATRGKQVQVDRFRTWGERGLTKTSRARNKQQIIGTARGEALEKTVKLLTLVEYTGPSDSNGNPSTLHVTYEDMMYSRQMLFQYGVAAFHQSIGSANLADDFQRWMDRIMILELMNTTTKLNPSSKADASTLSTDKFTTADLLTIKERLATNNTPRFPDGTYHGLISERMVKHLEQDDSFNKFAIALIQGGNPAVGNLQSPVVYGPGSVPQQVQGVPSQSPAPLAIRYEGFTLYPTNNIPTRTVNSLTAYLGLFFGPESVGIGSGGPGPRVKVHGDTDFDRHFHFIWQWYGEILYLLDDDDNSGLCVEARTYAA